MAATAAPGRRRVLRLLRLPAFWLAIVSLVAGAARIGEILGRAWQTYPWATSTAVVLFLLYAVPFLLILRVVDNLDGEPVPLLLFALGWGGMVATAAAIAGNAATQDLLAKLVSPRFTTTWGPAIAGASLEEVLKALAVVMVALVARPQLTSVMDGFVYGALAGLGFQVVENIIFAVNAVGLAGTGDQVGPVVAMFFLRGFLGGLWSHTLFTALAGAGIAFVVVRRDRPVGVRVAVVAGAFGAAAGFHFLWNSPLLADGIGYGMLGVLAALFLKGIPALVVCLALVRAADRREGDYYAAMLAGLGDHRMATPPEIQALTSLRARAAARRVARARLGAAGARAMRRLQKAQERLAVALSRDPGAELVNRRREVLIRRHQLLALSVAASFAPPRPHTILAAPATAAVGALVVAVGVVGLTLAIRALGGS
jgi:RsiW-degrading membrane proteinase PrsW (M82 family)